MGKFFKDENFLLIAPYAAWMVLMMILPSAPWAYATRTLVTLALLLCAFAFFKRNEPPQSFTFHFSSFTSSLLSGIAIGVAVLLVWVLPDSFAWYRKWCVIGDPYSSPSPLPLTSPLTWLQLFGSAFVIATAEELFFRKWLIRYAGFWWMVGLFAVEHNRPVVAAICGVLYGVLYLKKGLFAAIVAHITTNLLLGLYVLHTGHWEFW